MAEVTIYINGRSYDIACDNGQEGRVVDLASYIDQRLQQISRSGAAYNDAHLMVLTALVLADEIFDLRDSEKGPRAVRPGQAVASQAAAPAGIEREEEVALLRVLEQITRRIDGISTHIQQNS